MPNRIVIDRIVIGDVDNDFHPNAFKAALAEFVSTLIFVFAGQGSTMAYNKLTSNAPLSPAGLIVVALAHGFGLFVGVATSATISGGHCNPAVTFGAFIGGNISLLRGILYWIAQLLGSAVACLLLKFTTHHMKVAVFALSPGVTVWNAFVFEIVMTFALVYTVYATAIDPKKGDVGILAPLAIGLVLGANILAGGAFEGAAANPAVAFGPALVSWNWYHHWIYWAGPLIGGGLAGIVYELIFISRTHEPLPVGEY